MDKNTLIEKGWIKENEINLGLEFTDYCTCKCIMCNQFLNKENTPHYIPQGFMKFSLLKKIFSDLKKDKIKIHSLCPAWAGEALCHPKFNDMLKYMFRENKNNHIFELFTINTNATLLDKKTTNNILRCASLKTVNPGTFNKITFSLDAATRETFQCIKQVDFFDKVTTNIEYFIQKQQELGINDPKIIFQFIVMEENKDEAKLFLDRWSSFLKTHRLEFQINYDWFPPLIKHTILFTKLNCPDIRWAENLHNKTVKKLGLIDNTKPDKRLVINDQFVSEKNARRPCPAPWKTYLTRWDGEVTVCCKDVEMKLNMGNLNKMNLKEIIDSDKLKSLRLAQVHGNLKGYPDCQKCPNQPMPMMTDEEIIEYLISIGGEKIIKSFLERINKSETKGKILSNFLKTSLNKLKGGIY